MSETVRYKGTLTKVERLENEDLEAQCKRLLGNAELDSCCDDYQEMFADKYYKEYIIHDNEVYKVDKKELDFDADIFNMYDKKGKLEFEVMYYNGGCGFNEAIGYAFKNYKKGGE